MQSEATDKAISQSAMLRDLDSFCTNIDLPPNFKFVSKHGIDEQKGLITYYYESSTSFSESKAIFNKGLNDKGWTFRDMSDRYPPQLEFGKDEYRIVVTYQEYYSLSNYGIDCEKLR